MKNTSFNINFTNENTFEKDLLAVFKKHDIKVDEIKNGMSAIEIADVVSDKLIVVVKKQFDNAKKEFESTTERKS